MLTVKVLKIAMLPLNPDKLKSVILTSVQEAGDSSPVPPTTFL